MTASSAQIILSVILLFKLQDVISTDYWTDDFDASKNCDNEEEMARLSNLTPTQCVRVQVIDDEEKAFLQCKAILGGKIQEKCKDKKINNPGRLFYCKDRGHITCCHRNTTCFSWNNIQTQLYIDAKEYLMNKKKKSWPGWWKKRDTNLATLLTPPWMPLSVQKIARNLRRRNLAKIALKTGDFLNVVYGETKSFVTSAGFVAPSPCVHMSQETKKIHILI